MCRSSAGYIYSKCLHTEWEGMNDVFRPIVIMSKETEFSIFNRWGELLYSSLDFNEGWDGTFRGPEVKMDVYIYHITVVFYNGEERTIRGNVSVLR